MKYSKDLHKRVRQNLRMFDYPRFDDGDIDALLDEIERLQAERRWIPFSEQRPPENIMSRVIRKYKGVSYWHHLSPPPEEER